MMRNAAPQGRRAKGGRYGVTTSQNGGTHSLHALLTRTPQSFPVRRSDG